MSNIKIYFSLMCNDEVGRMLSQNSCVNKGQKQYRLELSLKEPSLDAASNF